jgi:hypothetical protein
MKRIVLLALVAFTVTVTSCGRKVTRIEPDKQVDLSGRWNNTDSRLTAEEMINDILKANWLVNHLQTKNGNRPVVICGFVVNKSHEHIEKADLGGKLDAFGDRAHAGPTQPHHRCAIRPFGHGPALPFLQPQ